MNIDIYLARFLVLLLILPAHEFAHGYAAKLNGDNTAQLQNRLTLNPLKHFDPMGLICFLIVGFGWAKPVSVNPYNFKNYKKGCIWVSIAGVLTNYALAFVFFPLMELTFHFSNYIPATTPVIFERIIVFVYLVFYCGYVADLSLFVFNLIPVFPLDGFRLLDCFANKNGKVYKFLRVYGYYILLGLVILSTIARRISALSFLDIFGTFMNYGVKYVGFPIRLFWKFVLGLFGVTV